ncbi:restriction endonuclease subunit S [Burkholderia pseudomallei]|uniref:restriction endonuclease subunit S n=1 Tax=Burkholderia pseudomallei TaxID=28450 RepID=UPI00052B0AF2|nr:restriction endonuclease subunit S [Burkholderia pseudomallei]AIV89062.1 type I restriction modification DNA specificity domain protein [Burkholderia pseudomallei B03]AIV96099.1 type I restriction modification DNA specificity domain protein [Burkholderia pseudomallei A79A]KGY05577.1 type I restriction modification DNA specificity domain protein [Burkholderia pseudomallei A79D]KGY06409.1 type I restriction modification DNA specificity domain protein [Burkholderia pseudomallei A79C]
MSLPRYSKYKDSGAAAVGAVPHHWEIKPIKAVASINDDVLPETTDPTFELAYVDIGSVSLDMGIEKMEAFTFKDAPSRARRLVRHGDVIVSTVRTYLKAIAAIAMPPENLVVSTGFAVIRPLDSVEPRFAKYALQGATFIDEVISRSTGVSYPAINASDLARIALPVPPRDEQSAIAAFLDRETGKIDMLIAEQEKLLTLLAEKRQATISHAVTRGVNPNAPMKDSGVAWLGEVPVHWTVVPLKRLLSDVKAGPFGSALTKDMYVSSGYRVYGQEQVIPADFSIGDYYISDSKFAELQQYSVKAGDILISCVGTFGKIAIVPEHVEPGIINPRLIRLRVGATMLGRYLEAVLRSSVVFEQFSMVSRGGTMDVINIGTLNAVTLAIPPTHEQEDLLAFLDVETAKLDKLKSEAERAIALLAERRSALIAAAVTGKIDVRNAVPQELAA